MNFKDILFFLSNLKKNNNREWFEANKSEFRKVSKQFEEIVGVLINRLSELDPQIGQLKPKDCIFRIYRDVRFSKDKSPYKNNFGAAISRGGRKSPFALYYLHIEDENSFIAGGIYQPPNDVLNKVRQEIDYNAKEFKSIIENGDFKNFFEEIEGEKLKRPPKGYDDGNENIELLKHKSYLAVHKIDNKTLLSDDFLDYCMKAYAAMRPLNDFINRALIE